MGYPGVRVCIFASTHVQWCACIDLANCFCVLARTLCAECDVHLLTGYEGSLVELLNVSREYCQCSGLKATLIIHLT